MRRSSIITIILLVLVIIGLTVALVFTNLTKNNVDDSIGTENNEVQDNEKTETPKAEEPKQVDLNSDIAVEMATLLHPSLASIRFDYFYEFQNEILNQENMSNKRKLQIAFSNKIFNTNMLAGTSFSKDDMDNAMNKVFGNTNYTPQEFDNMGVYYGYDSNSKMFTTTAGGGGGQGSHIIAGIYKIDEYSDRYEVYAKALVSELGDSAYKDGYSIGDFWEVKNADSVSPEYRLESYFVTINSDNNPYSYKTLEDIVSGITPKDFAKANINYDYTNQYKLLTKYFDQATEYKHTFMKNEDGSYYWVKSEIIK